jgi:hypothetical protein
MREFRPPIHPSKLRPIFVALVAVFAIVPTSILGVLAFSVSAITYTIADGELRIRSGGPFTGSRSVELSDIEEIAPRHVFPGRRVAGTGLPGYCVGKFRYSEFGDVWQATDCGRSVVVLKVRGERWPIVVSPPDQDAFLRQLHEREPGTVTLPSPAKGMIYFVCAVVFPLTWITAFFVGATLARGPSKMRYLVGDGALVVETIFGKRRWSTRGARARAYMPGRLWRVWGTAVRGYFTGLFREEGQLTRVYATDWVRPVLFEAGERVLLSPEDREGFLKALAEEGVSVTE